MNNSKLISRIYRFTCNYLLDASIHSSDARMVVISAGAGDDPPVGWVG